MPEALDNNPYRVCFWIQVHSVSFFNHAEKSDDATYICGPYTLSIEGLEQSTFVNKKYKNPGSGLMPICEVTDSRKQFRDQQTTKVENLDTTLVREDTHSRDLVVYAYETETVIVTQRLWGPHSKNVVR